MHDLLCDKKRLLLTQARQHKDLGPKRALRYLPFFLMPLSRNWPCQATMKQHACSRRHVGARLMRRHPGGAQSLSRYHAGARVSWRHHSGAQPLG